jgi:hypothetical protein
MPKLTCNVTGNSYYVTAEQLQSKSESVDLTINEFIKVYVCKKASLLLQKGHNIYDIRNLIDCAEDLPKLTPEQEDIITKMYMQSNIRRVLSNFSSVSSLAVNESDSEVSKYIAFLKGSTQ